MFRDPPASAGDAGSIPGPGRFHLPRSSLSPGPTAPEACGPKACARPQEKPLR